MHHQEEFNNLYQIDMNQTTEDVKWAKSRFVTSYADFLSAMPQADVNNLDEPVSRRSATQYGIFTVTHNGNSICAVQLTTEPVIHGDVIQVIADFSDTQIPCEQVCRE